MGIIYMSTTLFDLEMVRFGILKTPLERNSNSLVVSLQAMRRLDLSLLSLIIACTLSISTVFLYCYIGSLTTEQFHCFGDVSYESEWYELPVKQQKFILLIITDARRPLVFHGFNIISLNLWVFTTVFIIQTFHFYNVSNYIMLRSLIYRS